MVEKKEQNSFDLGKWNFIDRFKQVSETIIHNSPSNPSSNLNSIKVLNWNVAKSNYDRNWSKDFQTIIEEYQPNKIFLQEVLLSVGVEEIIELAQMNWAFAPNFIDTSNNEYSGILIATKGDRISSQAIITKHSEPFINTPKVSLFTKYSLANYSNYNPTDESESLLTVNTHLINFVSSDKFKIQLQEIESVIDKHQGAVILAGDFNTWNQPRWQMLSQMSARLNLTAVSFSAEDNKKIKNFLFSPPLDYIFYRGFTPKSYTAKVLDDFSSSDHNPLFVELDLNIHPQ